MVIVPILVRAARVRATATSRERQDVHSQIQEVRISGTVAGPVERRVSQTDVTHG